ncbi:sensor histidine kinase [Leptospira licerasiae]|uniref:histidine kinase n=1 Tax=Leptospira licerasiae str. MMD4847 TaxID=1049971 RepID=A0ABP2RJE6_9LEPT|nr:ATP-binding protein [Leptospira licerasiae]EIE01160.1 PAS domain S-box protein [Leptospira licerasiae serovar Varillal str. VAR 010]EJZ43743.1 PAS domain S-box protein [Leptospira licerasiae str. MMD4847]TGM88765.1 PAS domain-containing sensor histidine kinase [Leptospira licerasiae]
MIEIEIVTTPRLTAFPVFLAFSRGYFEEEDVLVRVRSLKSYEAVLAHLREGRAEAGEVPFTAWVHQQLKKTSPNWTFYRGIILSCLVHGFYSASYMEAESIRDSYHSFLPILHPYSLDRFVAEEFFRSENYHRRKPVPYLTTRPTLLAHEFIRAECLGAAASLQEYPFFGEKGYCLTVENEIPPYYLPTNMLVFTGRFASKFPEEANRVSRAIKKAMEDLANHVAYEGDSFVADWVGPCPWKPGELDGFYRRPVPELGKILSGMPALEDVRFVMEMYGKTFPGLDGGKKILESLAHSVADNPFPKFPSSITQTNSKLYHTYYSNGKTKLGNVVKDIAPLRSLVSEMKELALSLFLGRREVSLDTQLPRSPYLFIRSTVNAILDYLNQEIRDIEEKNKRLSEDNYLLETRLDISDLKRQTTEERYRYMFEFATDAMIIVNADTRMIVDANRRFREVSGYQTSEIKNIRLARVLPDILEQTELKSPGGKDQNMTFIPEAGLILKDGTKFSVGLSVTGFSAETKRFYQIQVNDNALILESEKIKHEFISNISHELRSPMTNIQGYFDLLFANEQLSLDKDQKEMTDVIRKNVRRLNFLIDNLLQLEKKESQTSEEMYEIFDPLTVIEEVLYINSPSASESGLTVTTDLAGGLKLKGVRFEFSQIITNFFVNAIKYTEKGGIDVSLKKISDKKVEVRFTDTGIGIDPKYKELIFERFFRVPDQRNRTVGGTGLGLSISRTLINKMGGEVIVEPNQKGGSIFKVILPLYSE